MVVTKWGQRSLIRNPLHPPLSIINMIREEIRLKSEKQVVVFGIGAIAKKSAISASQGFHRVQGREVDDAATPLVAIAEMLGNGISCAIFIGSLGGGETGERLLQWVTAFHNAMIPSITIVAVPFHFEGAFLCKRASLLLEEIRQNCDSSFVIESENILAASGKHITMEEAMKRLGNKLAEETRFIADSMCSRDDLRIGYSGAAAPILKGGMSYLRGSDIHEGVAGIPLAMDEALNRSIMALRSDTSARYYLRVITGPEISVSDVKDAYRVACIRWHLDPHRLALGWRMERNFGDKVQGVAIAMEGSASPKQYTPVAYPFSESGVTLTLHLEDGVGPATKRMGLPKGRKATPMKTLKRLGSLHHPAIGA